MVERGNSRRLLPKHYWEQPTYGMSEEERQGWACLLHKDFSDNMTENSFKVVSSKYNGNRGTLINRNIELTQAGVDTAHLTIPDFVE